MNADASTPAAVIALALGVASWIGCSPASSSSPDVAAIAVTTWPAYGGDLGGQRHTTVTTITPENVKRLAPAWSYRHADVSDGHGAVASESAFENTPILVDGTLYFCTPFNRVIALDPASGIERWTYDPEIDLEAHYANQLVCRGVTFWRDEESRADTACRDRIFTATNEARLIAIDATTGQVCPGFGSGGQVDLNPDVGDTLWTGEYQVTSPPAVVGDVVVVGSAVSDNQRIDAPSGVVRGYDARTGALRWAWDLAPPGFDYREGLTSTAGYALGTPNVWAPMSVDDSRGLVFVPTGNAAPDYFHGARRTMNHYGSSIVALHGATGEIAWHFQTVHDDLWDFDVPAQPTLVTIDLDGVARDALVQSTKMGLLFVLDRETGEPLHPISERPVPTEGAAPGEFVSPTQPFPRIPMLIRSSISPDDAWGLTPWDRGACSDLIERYRFNGMYTPPSLEGSIMYPGNAGGSNWGGISVDPVRQLAYVRSSDLAWVVQLIPRERVEQAIEERADGEEVSGQAGTPYGMRRSMLVSPLGLPCIPPPWGTLSAIDLRSGEIRWQVPHGGVRDLAFGLPIPWTPGVPGLGGPISTAGGVVFIAAAFDNYLRAFDAETGEELWKGRLPAGGQATPMSYQIRFEDGSTRQYVVIAAGGHARGGSTLGDHLVAFALEP